MIAVLALGGCASYEFVVVEPTELAGRLTTQERRLERGTITYHMVSQSDRVGIRIENRSAEPMVIRGEESFVVTPDGQSEPIRSSTIAPGSWAAITIPPLIRTFDRRGGMMVGVGMGSWSHGTSGGVGVGADMSVVPREEVAWRWREGSVRMQIVLASREDQGERIEHDFVIVRRRLK